MQMRSLKVQFIMVFTASAFIVSVMLAAIGW